MRKDYNNGFYQARFGKPHPDQNSSKHEVWAFALSFNGYDWVKDLFYAKELTKYISHPDHTRFLDQTCPGWRSGEGEPCAVALLSCIGDGKVFEEDNFEVNELKAILFFEQRANRWHQEWSADSLEFAKSIIEKINALET